MKRSILIISCAATTLAWQPVVASTGPVRSVADKTAQFAHKVANTLDRHLIEPTDRHVIEPARRTIVNHTPPWRHHDR
jgi:hypothetical protein